MDLSKTIVLNRLYDFYGNCLTARQQRIFEDYYLYNISLGEIAQNLNITRQAVHDSLSKTEKVLEDLDSKLGLLEKYDKQKAIIDKLDKSDKSQLLALLKVWEK